MIKLSMLFKKTVLVALVAALAIAALPVTHAYASGLNDPDVPPADTIRLSDERLEQIWARMQHNYERQGCILERADAMTERVQTLINGLEENGKDVTAMQAALDAFEDAIKEAHPIYVSAKGIINSHQGFDVDGKVTDHEKAVETVKDLGGKLKEVREIVGERGRALRQALKAFRKAHRPADTSNTQR